MYNPRVPDSQRELMLSTSQPVTLALVALTVLTAGCARDTVSVNRYQLISLNETVSSHQADLTYLRVAGDSRHNELMDTSQESTRRILDAISEQVKPPECPPAPRVPACTVAESGETGRGERVNGKLVVGEVEKAFLMGPDFVYDARVDSGAETSSMDARDVKRFERDGKEWVRFDVPVPDSEPEAAETLERRVVRNVRIIQANQEDHERRPVVELQFQIGTHIQKAEFTLSDRAHLTYPLLIGRNILRDVMLIDVGKEYSTELPRALITRTNADN